MQYWSYWALLGVVIACYVMHNYELEYTLYTRELGGSVRKMWISVKQIITAEEKCDYINLLLSQSVFTSLEP